jgi:hypothetical protein
MRASLVLVFALLVLGSACAGSDGSDSAETVAGGAGLTDLHNLDDFARAFAADADHPRLVLLLSPT